MGTSRRPQFANVVDAIFDAALLLDKKGKVRHVNDDARELLELDGQSASHCDMLFLFMSSSMPNMTSFGDISWKDVYPQVVVNDQSLEWSVTCIRQGDESKFAARARFAKVVSSDGHNYVVVTLREDGDAFRKKKEEKKVFDDSTDPMMAIDERGTVLMFNQRAVDAFDWCTPESVGQGLPAILTSVAHRWREDPVMSIDERGHIQAVNDAALLRIPWCSRDMIGTNILSLEEDFDPSMFGTNVNGEMFGQGPNDDNVSDDDTVANERPARGGRVVSWLSNMTGKGSSKKGTTETKERKPSPEVLRVYVTGADGDLLNNDDEETTLNLVTDGATDNQTNKSASEFQLRESMMMAIVEASLDPLIQINEKGIIQMVNQAAVRLFGYRREQFLGSNVSMIVGGGHAPNHDRYIRQYLKTGRTSVMDQRRELVGRKSDGFEFPIELAVVEVDTFQGDERLFCGYIRDLTSMKRKERLTRNIVEASLDPMFLVNESGQIRMTNEASTKLFGFERDEFLGSNIDVVVGGGHADRHSNYIRRYLSTGTSGVIGAQRELVAKKKTGEEFPIQRGVVEMETTAEEERMFCGFVHDLTDLKAREAAIKHRERIVSGIINASLDPIVQINADGIIQTVNKAATVVFGFTEEEFLGSNVSIIVGGDHARQHDKYIQRFLATGKGRVMGTIREVPAMTKAGKEILVELSLTEIETEEGEERRFRGYLRHLKNKNPTDRTYDGAEAAKTISALTSKAKRQEASLVKRDRLITGILNASLDPMFQIGQDGTIQVANQSASQLLRCKSKDDLRGTHLSKVFFSNRRNDNGKPEPFALPTQLDKHNGQSCLIQTKTGKLIQAEISVASVKTGRPNEVLYCCFARNTGTGSED